VDGTGAGGAFATVLVCVVELCVDAGTGGFAGFAGGLALIVAGEIVAGEIVAGEVLVLLPLAGIALLGAGTLDFAALATAFPLGLTA
jgi:hypothetical protein